MSVSLVSTNIKSFQIDQLKEVANKAFGIDLSGKREILDVLQGIRDVPSINRHVTFTFLLWTNVEQTFDLLESLQGTGITILSYKEGIDFVLATANLETWVNVITTYSAARIFEDTTILKIVNKVQQIIESFNLSSQFQGHSKESRGDGSFHLCNKSR